MGWQLQMLRVYKLQMWALIERLQANTHNDGKKTVNLYWSEKIIGSFS